MNEAEISRRLKGMIKLAHDATGWRALYRDASDKTLWEVTYPMSEMHGGGPRQLEPIAVAEAINVYGIKLTDA